MVGRKTVASLALATWICLQATPLAAESLTLEEVAKIGKEATEKLHKELRHEVESHKEEGIVAMAKSCIENSQKITARVDEELGKRVDIRRISQKYRNSKNQPQPDEVKVLEAYGALFEANVFLPEYVIALTPDGEYKYYQPITLSDRRCIECHGKRENISAQLRSLFAKHYPDDKAVDYSRGDFRGAFVVTIRQSDLQK